MICLRVAERQSLRWLASLKAGERGWGERKRGFRERGGKDIKSLSLKSLQSNKNNNNKKLPISKVIFFIISRKRKALFPEALSNV